MFSRLEGALLGTWGTVGYSTWLSQGTSMQSSWSLHGHMDTSAGMQHALAMHGHAPTIATCAHGDPEQALAKVVVEAMGGYFEDSDTLNQFWRSESEREKKSQRCGAGGMPCSMHGCQRAVMLWRLALGACAVQRV